MSLCNADRGFVAAFGKSVVYTAPYAMIAKVGPLSGAYSV